MALPMKAPQTPLVIGLTDCAARLEQEHGRLAALMKQAIARSIGGGVTAA
jgi:hypothetical protein